MDEVLETLQRLEKEVTELKEDLAGCKKQLSVSRDKVDRLERKLVDSQSRIKELEKDEEDTPTTSTRPCHCLKYTKELKFLEKKLEKMEKECDDFKKETDKISRLQSILNSLVLKSQKGIEKDLKGHTDDAQSESSTSSETHQSTTHAVRGKPSLLDYLLTFGENNADPTESDDSSSEDDARKKPAFVYFDF